MKYLAITISALAALMLFAVGSCVDNTDDGEMTIAADSDRPAASSDEAMEQPEGEPVPLESATDEGWGGAYDFSYTLFSDGSSHKLSDNLGTPVVLNFWAAWCPPCKAEMPDFEEVYAEKGDQFTLLAVAIDEREDPGSGMVPKDFFAEQGFSYTGAYDETGAGSQMYGVQAIPTTIFIDRNGDVVHEQKGMMSREDFEKYLAEIL